MRWIAVAFVGTSLMISGCVAPATTAPAAAGAAGAGATGAAGAAAAPAAAAHPTLLEFLGLCQIAEGIGKAATCGLSVLGSCFPGLEPKPALVPITAAGGEGASPAVQAAADIKAEEDKAAQKIKAIRYLAGLGCVKCYSGIEEAFLAALEDCTEEVRFEAAKGLREAAGNPCHICSATSCCSPKIVEKLQEIAEKTDSQGCYVEPSPRVRRMARLALNRCSGRTLAVEEEPTPAEGPAGDTAEEPIPPPPEGQATTHRTQAAIALFESPDAAPFAAGPPDPTPTTPSVPTDYLRFDGRAYRGTEIGVE